MVLVQLRLGLHCVAGSLIFGPGLRLFWGERTIPEQLLDSALSFQRTGPDQPSLLLLLSG